MSRSVDFAIRNMTKILPATVRAHAAILISRSVLFSTRDVTKALPVTVRAHIAILTRLFNRAMTKVPPALVWSSDSNYHK